MSKLEILNGKRQGDTIDLSQREHDIGTKRTAAISIRDPWISFKHAKIGFENNHFFIEDLNSTNGVWINGTRIKRQSLQDGDLVYLGKTKIRFQEATNGAAAAPAAATSSDLRDLQEERDELLRIKDVLERFLDVGAEERVQVLEKVQRPEPIVDTAALDTERQRAEGLEKQLAEARKEKETFESQAIARQREAEDAEEAIKKLETDLAELNKQLEAATAQAEASAGDQEKVAALEKQVEELQREKGEAERSVEEAQLEAKQAAEKVKALEEAAEQGAAAAASEVETKHLEEQIALKDKALGDAQGEAEKLRAQIQELEKEVAILTKKVGDLEKYSTDLQASSKKEVEKATDNLQKEVRIKARALEDAQRAQKSAEDKAKELAAQLEEAKGQSGGGEADEALKAELAEAKKTIEQLTKAAESSGGGGDAAALNAKIDQLTKERDTAVKDRDETLKEMQETRTEIDQISMEQIQLEDELEKLQKENEALKGKAG